MIVQQISVFLENRPGRLMDMLQVLADNGVDIRALSQADTADFGIARLVLSDTQKAVKALNDAGKEYLYDASEKLGLFFIPTFGNFIFVDFARDSRVVFEALLKKGIVTRMIKEYGFPNALRISIGSEAQNLRLIRALRQVL